jgi:hypothetical protein
MRKPFRLSSDEMAMLHQRRIASLYGHWTHRTKTLIRFLKVIETKMRKFSFQPRCDPGSNYFEYGVWRICRVYAVMKIYSI